jgi:hypothetical protein
MAKEMTKEEALQILKDYQLWRTGKADYFPVSPKKLSEAIVLATELLQKSIEDGKE